MAAVADPNRPFWREFLLSSGFGGLTALLAAIIAATAAIIVARRTARSQNADRGQRELHHREILLDSINSRTEEFRGAAVGRCWDRLVWLIEHATENSSSPTHTGPLGLRPELMEQMLQLLQEDAMRLGDIVLARAVNSYLIQFALTLAAQAGSPPSSSAS